MAVPEKRHFLIMYDICDPKRLKNVAKWLENFACRLQLSVFEAEFDDETLRKVRNGLSKIIDDGEDSVYIFPLCALDWAKREAFGMSRPEEDEYNAPYQVL